MDRDRHLVERAVFALKPFPTERSNTIRLVLRIRGRSKLLSGPGAVFANTGYCCYAFVERFYCLLLGAALSRCRFRVICSTGKDGLSKQFRARTLRDVRDVAAAYVYKIEFAHSQ